ncbi:hypothetical protein MARINON1_20381 [Marinobacter salarius]|nr:hypothetical protein MBHK15_80128 [Marinobacter salarius]VXB05906.1 hypothetical protein MARINON1_20381 [Marinobacter salarius]
MAIRRPRKKIIEAETKEYKEANFSNLDIDSFSPPSEEGSKYLEIPCNLSRETLPDK